MLFSIDRQIRVKVIFRAQWILSGGFRAVGPGYRIIGLEQPSQILNPNNTADKHQLTEIRRVA